MRLLEFAADYSRSRNLSRGNLRYTAARYARLCGQCDVERLTTARVEEYRSACRVAGLSPRTIESSIGDLITLHHAATGNRLNPGQRLRVPRPVPRPADLGDIAAAYSAGSPWLRQWIALAYWTCARLTDSLILQASLDGVPDVIRWTAGKTGRIHSVPVPPWLSRHLSALVVAPIGDPANHLKRVVRRQLREAAAESKANVITPHAIRQRGLTEWSRTNAMAGGIVHGSGLGVLDHYVDPLTVLEAAAPAVRLPAGFATPDEIAAASALPRLVERLSPADQRLVAEFAARLAN